jgi:hypothetical protein
MKEETKKDEQPKRTFVRLLTFEPTFYKRCKEWFDTIDVKYMIPSEYKPIMHQIYWALLKIKWGGAEESVMDRLMGSRFLEGMPADLSEPTIKMQLKQPRGWVETKYGRIPQFMYSGDDGVSKMTPVAAIPQVFMYIGEADDDNFKVLEYTEDTFKQPGPVGDILNRIRQN